MINVELEAVEWLRAGDGFASDEVVTLLPDQKVSDPWPEQLVWIVLAPFIRPQRMAWGARKAFIDRPKIEFHCYAGSKQKAWELWDKVADRFYDAPFARDVTLTDRGVYVRDDSAPEDHIDRYIGNMSFLLVNL